MPSINATDQARRVGGAIGRGFTHFVVWLYAAILAVPLLYLILSSVKTNTDIFSSPFGWPKSWEWENFSKAWTQAQLGRGLMNSALVTLGSEALTLLLAIPAGYALSRARGRVAVIQERIFSAGFLVPAFAAIVPTVLLAAMIGLFQTRTFLILFLPATALPLSVVLLTQYMHTIPEEIEESARVDGAGRMSILLRIILPMAVPGIVTVALLNFMSFWNEYLFSLVILGPSPKIRTVQIALPTLVTETAPRFGVLAAGTLISLVPVYLLYMLLQRRMEEALVQGALKG